MIASLLLAAVAVNLRCEYLENPLGVDASRPRLSWQLAEGKQTAYQIVVDGLWDSGRVESDETVNIPYAGPPLASRQRVTWRVRVWPGGRWSQPATWEMGLLRPEDWTAKWIDAAPIVRAPASVKILRATYETLDGQTVKEVTELVRDGIQVSNDTLGGDPAPGKPKQLRADYEADGQRMERLAPEGGQFTVAETWLPWLRKTFALKKRVARARLYATALGLYELQLNGRRVGDHALAPDWTDYNTRVRYQVYDVTRQLRSGTNTLMALVGDGWYCGHIGLGGYRLYGNTPALLAQLEIAFADGSTERIVTDETWQRARSPILSSDLMLGENYDARVTGDDWQPVSVREEKARRLDAQVMEPVRQLAQLPARAVTEPRPGQWVFDLGQNMVGVVRLKVNAPAGTKITLRHAEMLHPDGTLYTANLRKALATDTYIGRGGGTEVWQPRFTFHGFRYVELTGLKTKPSLDTVTGIVLGSDTRTVGEFSCSDQRLNQLQRNIRWGQRGNFLSVPTDCPQRDERLGWMGDAQVFIRTAAYNADVAAFFTKWMVDVEDAQRPDGRFTDVSPVSRWAGGGVPGWGDAGVICPWTVYQMYGDTRILERHFPAMVKWIEWCREHSTELIRDRDRGSDYGDWLSIGANTPKDLIGTAYFAHSTHLVANMARALGKTDEAAKYQRLFEDIKAAFNKRYVREDGRIAGDTQTAYLLALKFELLPEKLRARAAQHLEDDIRAKGWHLSTGFLGVSYLLPVLAQTGKLDAAYRLLLQDTFPSWLFPVKHGATTIWERWDGWTPEKGFQDPGMNSFNHYSLGSCGEWLLEGVAGIRPGAPGFKTIVIQPAIADGLTWARASYRSVRGKIASEWKRDGRKLTLTVTIPGNTTATIYLPGRKPFEVGPGTRTFNASLP